MGIMNCCLRRGGLGFSGIYLRYSDIGSLGFFFCVWDEWETPSDEVWGDLPGLLRWWGTSNLGALLFLLVF